MLFNSFNFWLIFPSIFVIYWAVPSKYYVIKKWVLLLVSYLLYMNWKPFFAGVLLFVSVLTFVGSKQIVGCKQEKKKLLLSVFLILSLLPLVLFKYYDFVNESGILLLELCGFHFSLPGLNWAVPVGISFYTFQAVGYMLDVYYGKISPEKNFTDYLLFCSFFPQTASGPISRYSELMPQIKSPKPFSYEQAREGLQILLWGMFLKVVVADRLGIYVDTVYEHYEHYSGITCFVASIFYTFQIYGDFAGYSLMAVGIAKTLGFDLVNNFERPYLATSITNFWRRWHISLTRWLTSYVYIPLGGSRCSTVRQYMNIMVTFLVSGLWHGANWTFVVWGALHGVFQIAEKALGLDPKGRYAESMLLNRLKPLRILVTFLLVNLAWIFFRMPTIGDAVGVIERICLDRSLDFFYDTKTMITTNVSVLIVVIGKDMLSEYSQVTMMNNHYRYVRWFTYLLLFFSLLLFGVLDSGQFIYVSF
ncbi:MAG: MBOAT family protein [Bacteroidaceae bacterium]|nr:MBOAT family protein [Bacteroidaceae bacterium]